jgi:hypothetical protein
MLKLSGRFDTGLTIGFVGGTKNKKKWYEFYRKIKIIVIPFVVSIPFVRAAFNRADRRFDVVVRFDSDDKVGFIVGIEVDGFVGVFTIVDEGLVVVADVNFPFACARIWATSGDKLSSDNEETLDVTVGVGFVEAKDTLVDAELLLLFTGDIGFDADDEEP